MRQVEVPLWPVMALGTILLVLFTLTIWPAPTDSVTVLEVVDTELLPDGFIQCADREPLPGETLCADLMLAMPLTYVICFDVPDDRVTAELVCATIGEFRDALEVVLD